MLCHVAGRSARRIVPHARQHMPGAPTLSAPQSLAKQAVLCTAAGSRSVQGFVRVIHIALATRVARPPNYALKRTVRDEVSR